MVHPVLTCLLLCFLEDDADVATNYSLERESYGGGESHRCPELKFGKGR